jgi:predicted aminopeptidase
MIQESYVKEICRIKKQMEVALAEETKDESLNNPPTTASSSHRFASRKIQKRGNSTLRKFETTIISNHDFARPAKTIRAAAHSRG